MIRCNQWYLLFVLRRTLLLPKLVWVTFYTTAFWSLPAILNRWKLPISRKFWEGFWIKTMVGPNISILFSPTVAISSNGGYLSQIKSRTRSLIVYLLCCIVWTTKKLPFKDFTNLSFHSLGIIVMPAMIPYTMCFTTCLLPIVIIIITTI